MDHAAYYTAIHGAVRAFFDFLHFADWKFVREKSGVHILRHITDEPSDLCFRGTTTIHASAECIRDVILDVCKIFYFTFSF